MRKNEKPYADDYISYLENFDRFDEIPVHCKKTYYVTYLENLCDYLVLFFKNTKPLVDSSKLFDQMELKFDTDWQNGNIPGWEEEIKKARAEVEISEDSKQLSCIPCKKFFSNEMSLFYHKKGKKHIKVINKLTEGALSMPQNDTSEFKDEKKELKIQEIARLESKIIHLKGVLSDVIFNSANEARKKHSQTYQEIEAENQDIGVDEIESSEDEADGPNVKTRHLPLGSDGKPIPYWLYKLHGLGVEFK